MQFHPDRRNVLLGAALSIAGGPAQAGERNKPFGYCLNTSTIRGQKLGLMEKIDIASRAGFDGIEPWINEMDQHVKDGGTLKDAAKKIRDSGLSVESSIAFFEWIVDDDAKRQKAMEDAKRSMEMVKAIGGKRIAAPPAGATQKADNDLPKIARRYKALADLAEQFDLVAELEIWGFSQTLNRLSDAAYVTIAANHPRACLLPDVYHLYKGGSGFTGLRLVSGQAIGVFHFNDYPATPPRAEITDAQRIYPGDGVAPLKQIVADLKAIGYRGMLSLELFNRDYWQKDAFTVARVGLEKMKAVVERA